MLVVKLALRNLRRNLRRTIITLLAISVGLVVMLLGLCLQYGSYEEMIDSGVSQIAGHVVVQKEGYQEEREPLMVLENTKELSKTLQEAFPNATITKRAFLGGLLTSPKGPAAANVIAVDPKTEGKISEFKGKLIKGEWIDDDPKSIVIGSNMAETLGVKIGQKIVFTAQYDDTEMKSHLFRVKGIFRMGSTEADSFIAYSNLAVVETILNKKDALHQVAVHLDDVHQSKQATSKSRGLISQSGLDVLSWNEALPDIEKMIQIDRQSNGLIHLVLAIIVAMGILNTMLMSVLERTKELGVLLAIGMKPMQLSIMVLLEGLFIGVFGSLLGLALGYAACYPLVTDGLDLTAQMGESYDAAGVTISAMLYGAYHWPSLIQYAVLAAIFSTLSAIYPAWRITKLKPVDAMRHH
ncbi:MAG: FtsX-like permease family protein [Myxococcota bacterium]|nr:FtsX-like permease family protein [Myxococcota bacterium]